MSNWNKNLGISKSDWENLTPATQELLWNRSKKEEAKDKAKAKKITSRQGGRSQKEGQEVGKKYTVTSKVTTQGDKAPTKFLESVIKHLKK
jgi:hypothetical protein